MHAAHRHQAPLLERTAPSLGVLEADAPQQHAAPQIEFLAVRQELNGSRIEPVLLGDAKLEREPVGAIHESDMPNPLPAARISGRRSCHRTARWSGDSRGLV